MTIVIILEGGAVQEVISDQETKVIVIDRDNDHVEDHELTTVLGHQSVVYKGITSSTVDIQVIKQVIEEVSENE
jgi:hypothetical protein